MSPNDTNLSETDIRSPGSRTWCVRAATDDPRPWLVGAPVCPELQAHRIAHLGVAKMRAPFEIVRTKLGGTYFLSCRSGAGRVFVDGRWKTCEAGQAFLLSPGTLHAFHATEGAPWEFSWIRYAEGTGRNPIAGANSPVLAEMDPAPLQHAVFGLFHSTLKPSMPAATVAWIEMIQRYVEHFAGPATLDPRLARVWDKVAKDLARPWTSGELATTAHLSEKQFERLCRRELGRTPRQHLIWLRIREAARRLTSGSETIETIAAAVGYANPFTFSTTFRRFTGWSPSRYPGRR